MSTPPVAHLFALVAKYGPEATELATRALAVASDAHHGQFRRSGDLYITHPIAVATVVAELDAGIVTIAAALLHDVSLDTTRTLEQLRSEFGAEVGGVLADYVRLEDTTSFDDIAGDIDPRAVILKVADRLHNLRTIKCLTKAKQQRKADQTRHEFVPRARALGLVDIATELDLLATNVLGFPPGTTASTPTFDDTSGVAHGLLRVAVHTFLPVHCRQRWLSEWNAELHELPSRRDKLSFVLSLILGLPVMAIHARRDQLTHDGDRR